MEKWFTPEERGVILFIVLVLLAGVCICVYKLNKPYLAPEFNISSATQFNTNTKIERVISESRDKKLKVGCEKININTAGVEELIELQGIGPVYAERIIAYRNKHGNFKTPEDIMQIKGIGEKTFEKFRAQITVQ